MGLKLLIISGLFAVISAAQTGCVPPAPEPEPAKTIKVRKKAPPKATTATTATTESDGGSAGSSGGTGGWGG
ncbi:MAG: hypothetical protein GY952_02990 [Rhodobacteraceae bacterium]|nr:hypothetical protein [Paracoccaceae bacterium]